ncbi:MAG TPA: YihY/virulence factor BrkB family protein, partial [Miltoncostaeaceae bacterium]|nr:YihY/virulence factor BrkB family protein [Miltoncostaeaceae bacterium]
PPPVSTASAVPVTVGELEGDEALETLRRTGRRRLLLDAFTRLRAADGFSHARALAFQMTLTLIPALIAVVGFAEAVDQERVREVVRAGLQGVAPGASGDVLTAAIDQGSRSGGGGVPALLGGLAAALFAGTIAMAQVERGANRIYGLERDRDPVLRYGLALLLACTAGVLVLSVLAILVVGDALGRAAGVSDELELAWRLGRWPLGLLLLGAATALLFARVPRRRQPEPSWLAVGAGLSMVLWLAFTAALAVVVDASGNFGATYGPLAGMIAVLLWAFLTALALLFGLAFAAQLEAVRAGVPGPRVDRAVNTPP